MLFQNLEEKVEYKTYSEDEKRVGLHLSIPKEIAENLNELKAVYDSSKIDNNKLEKSLFVSMVLNEFFEGLSDSNEGLIDIMGKMKLYKIKEGI